MDTLQVLRSSILESVSEVPGQDVWRIRCLKNYLELKYQREAKHQDTGEIDELIDAVCAT